MNRGRSEARNYRENYGMPIPPEVRDCAFIVSCVGGFLPKIVFVFTIRFLPTVWPRSFMRTQEATTDLLVVR